MLESYSYINGADFKTYLIDIISERINELVSDITTYEKIDRARGLFIGERKNLRFAREALKINERWMKTLNPDYTGVQ